MQDSEEFQNPIDKDNITETPGSLPYAHHRGSAVIKTSKESVIKSRSLSAMEDQTEMQLQQIRRQIELLAQQAQEIKERKELSLKIYQAKMNFAPLIGDAYYLYETEEGGHILSMIGPNEWGRSRKFKVFLAKVRLLADHTWMKEEV
ncbi:MAG TPA: DUF2452 domain-containing protein [Flavobacteriales bacterium]|nr:DUF2452 domain-containing protein [Flavobacteriales bacterium]HCA83700.1 DUF2452 domain-containing protein [Flavobacteriales bacterium]HRE76135.1 DUF2452 domain-containing protein [Flavobacteriales bacterium]HRE95943.1 DUF2452 domain-containing protein [Flavobacteriales bacterium]HRJ36400.1 DUF2452 domain-containing protein [Flavobacteriales bacterium]